MGPYQIIYNTRVIKDDIARLSISVQKKIKQAIEQKLATAPVEFGHPLRSPLNGMRKLRVGDYRVIFFIRGEMVYIEAIGHRSNIYDLQ